MPAQTIVITLLMTFVLVAPLAMVAVLVSGVVRRRPTGVAAPLALQAAEPAWREPVGRPVTVDAAA
jgi:Tfp pilus assembly protein PilX